MLNLSDRIQGGMWGLLVGDALGVPYEFHPAKRIPAYEAIEMDPPAGYDRTYPWLKAGTWSDDGAQALCLLDSLLANGQFNLNDFANRIVSWKDNGLWAVDRHVFDCGIQTASAIDKLRSGSSPTRSGFVNPDGKGNGSLMRVLPLALWHQGQDEELIEDAHLQSVVTHGHVTNQVCCALYCLWARRLLQGEGTEAAYQNAVTVLREHYRDRPEYHNALETEICPDKEPESNGSGYVVSTLHAARVALREQSYEAVVKKAISLGNDTDTNSAVAGGLAGIREGMEAIPSRWIGMMRGKDLAEPLIARLLDGRV
ncbi:ADP-ribosylglycohydrolase family protein [Alicyclobacillus ferrooxydans]|uniref:Crystallin n=1 Tax=Alicyclobacillus ferrooxydans TaxID=471514 RepID=A0A0P9CZH5_9BACL|nr:ADP-ribosylglycohydrolase family protein [Alicyclobacillus ferrooxydans]KPV45116.1 crystallin [Alicyclobacillus ferrooxydans]